MARPYREARRLATAPTEEAGTVVVLGVRLPGVPEPVPVIVSAGHEYRIREAGPGEAAEEGSWLLERRSVDRAAREARR